MAGTLVIDTLSNGSVSTSSTNCIQGSAKAWVNLNGTTGAIKASYNVSSTTRNASGNYTINFTNAFANTNYCWSGSAGNDNINGTLWLAAPPLVALSTWKQTGSINVVSSFSNTLYGDAADISFLALR